ncbi:MAG: hypothetical protein BVN35_09275 [Proteobacteria bacterium ST_bin11]|nr:MAG: hypothetical protein BVN35_09275 [Proteobacteria bacterium ST_bin11]
MLHRVEINVIDMMQPILFVANGMFPITALPDGCTAVMTFADINILAVQRLKNSEFLPGCLVPKLRLGNSISEAPLPDSTGSNSFRDQGSQARAWEPVKSGYGSLDAASAESRASAYRPPNTYRQFKDIGLRNLDCIEATCF